MLTLWAFDNRCGVSALFRPIAGELILSNLARLGGCACWEFDVGVVVERVERATDEARTLIEALEDELSGSYAAEQRHGLNIEQVFQPSVCFFIARLDHGAHGLEIGERPAGWVRVAKPDLTVEKDLEAGVARAGIGRRAERTD